MSAERLCWCGAAAVFFLPLFDTLWKGNVSGFLALLLVLAAGAARTAGSSVATAICLKLVPVALLPGLVGRGRRARAALGSMTAIIVIVSLVMAPHAWADYLVVLPNLLGGGADYEANLAPAVILDRAGAPDPLPAVVRGLTILVAGLCMAGAFRVARRSGGGAAAAALGTAAMLLLPAAIWYHYLVVLLPLAVLAWPRASARLRVVLIGAGAAISVGLAWLPLATLGAVALAAAIVVASWPVPGLPAARGWWPAR
jgi:hypothetical protein